MKILTIFLLMLFIGLRLTAQAPKEFNLKISIPCLEVQSQDNSSTCWSFSGLSFLESEMLRMGKPSIKLSEMFIVRCCYEMKANRYVRYHGDVNFTPGGAFHDVLIAVGRYGLLPVNDYPGLISGNTIHNHNELHDGLEGFLKGVVNNESEEISTAWNLAVMGILDAYLGKIPVQTLHAGKSYSPKSFAQEVCGIVPDDYMAFTSFTHHPFYSQCMLEMPDNWANGLFYNIPLEELMAVIDHALENGYSIAWAADVSESTFRSGNTYVDVPATADLLASAPAVNQEIRQNAFDNYKTTDDHGMHMVGRATDKDGNAYYYVKNSWGTKAGKNGFHYFSADYVRYKTLNILVHKDGVPKEILKKCGL